MQIGRKERKIVKIRVQILGLYIQQKNTHQRNSEESKQRIGMCLGNRRKWEGDFRSRMMMFESRIESIQMIETRRGREKKLRRVVVVDRETPEYIHCEGRVEEN
jgi:hypothetical protein